MGELWETLKQYGAEIITASGIVAAIAALYKAAQRISAACAARHTREQRLNMLVEEADKLAHIADRQLENEESLAKLLDQQKKTEETVAKLTDQVIQTTQNLLGLSAAAEQMQGQLQTNTAQICDSIEERDWLSRGMLVLLDHAAEEGSNGDTSTVREGLREYLLKQAREYKE